MIYLIYIKLGLVTQIYITIILFLLAWVNLCLLYADFLFAEKYIGRGGSRIGEIVMQKVNMLYYTKIALLVYV